MRNYKYNYLFKLSYNGARFNGLQIQNLSANSQSELNSKPQPRTVAGVFESVLLKLFYKDFETKGNFLKFSCAYAGRTDTGVHASSQYVNIKTNVNFFKHLSWPLAQFIELSYQKKISYSDDNYELKLANIYDQCFTLKSSASLEIEREDAPLNSEPPNDLSSIKLSLDFHKNKLIAALNANLPTDLKVQGLNLMMSNFNARFDAKERSYSYKLYTNKQENPLLAPNVMYYKYIDKFEMSLIQARITELSKITDWREFTPQSEKYENYQCKLSEFKFINIGESYYELRLTARRFLRHMVRKIVADLVNYHDLRRAERPRMRKAQSSFAKETFAPGGLTLSDVKYDEDKFIF